jgi:hypothetical protein
LLKVNSNLGEKRTKEAEIRGKEFNNKKLVDRQKNCKESYKLPI